MTELFKTSQSKVNTWRTCRRKFWYRYIEKLRRRVKSRPLKFGSIIHEMEDVRANKKDPFKHLDQIEKEQGKLFREEVEEYGDIVADIRYIMREYYDYYKDDPIEYVKINGKFSEHEFEVELPGGLLAKGKVDGLVHRKKVPAILEHKSHKEFPNEDHRWRNVQTSIYTRFVEMLGWFKPEGVLWNYIRSKSPTRPAILKDGTLSKRQLDSLPSVVVDVLKENKLRLNDYKDVIAQQEANRRTWFRRILNPNRKRTQDALFKDFIETSLEMADLSHKTKTRTIGRHCMWCDFEPLCRASLTGGDVEYIISKEYTEDASEDYETETAVE